MCVSVISFSLLFFSSSDRNSEIFHLYLERRIIKFMILHTIKSIFQSLHQPRWEIQSILEGKLGNWYHYLSSLLWSLSRLASQIIVARDVSDLTSRVSDMASAWPLDSNLMTPVARLPIGPCSVWACLSPPSCDAAYAPRQSLQEKPAGRQGYNREIDLRQLHWLHLLDCVWLL